MSEHRASVNWKRTSTDFSYETYNRDHTWSFSGGIVIEASAAPDFMGSPALVDPEEGFVATLSSCHMLTFLALAAKRRLTVDSYTDAAVGFLEKNEDGKLAVTRAALRPEVTFSGKTPSAEELDHLHHLAHEHCFIANSVKTEISIGS